MYQYSVSRVVLLLQQYALQAMLFLVAFLSCAINSGAQQADGTQVEYQTASGLKYLVYIPQGYNANTGASYPLLIYLHGGGDINDAYDINQLTGPTPHWAPPWLIAHSQWPSSRPFIVVSPLLKRDPAVANYNDQTWPMDVVDGLVELLKTNYRVNANKIYFTGMSLGAAGCWSYAGVHPEKVAGLLVFAGNTDLATACTVANVPVWAFHGVEDGFVLPVKTTAMIDAINACPGPYKAHLNLLFGRNHEGWNEVYNLKMGYQVFDWLLQFSKNDASNKAPYVYLGQDQMIMMRSGSYYLSAEYFDADGTIASANWTQTGGATLPIETDNQHKLLKIKSLAVGTFTFQLSVTDNSGNTTSASINVQVVSSTSNPVVTNITLYNGDTNQPIVNLSDDIIINKATVGATKFNLQATVVGTVHSTQFNTNADQYTSYKSGDAPYTIVNQWTLLTIPITGVYNICATGYPGWNGYEGTQGVRQCFKASFYNQPVQTFYPKAGMDISQLSSWGTNTNGSGTAPSSFSGDFQNFNIDKSVVLNGSLALNGVQSNLYVKDGGSLTINAGLTATVNIEGNAVVNVNTSQPVTFGTVSPTSTINFDQSVTTIPQVSYGNLSMSGAGSVKTLPSGSTIVAGNLTIADNVTVQGNGDNTSVVSLGGNLIINEDAEFNPSTRFGLNLTGTSQLLTVSSSKVCLGQLTVGTGNAELRTSGAITTLEIGSPAGGGLVINSGGTFNLNNHTLVLSQNSSLNSGGQTGMLAMAGGTLSFTATSGAPSNLYLSSDANTIQSLLIDQSGGGVVNILNTALITDYIQAKNGTIHSNGNISLVSTQTKTARIEPIEGSGVIEGSVEFQRFVDGNNMYKYISFPVSSVKVSDLQNFIPITGSFSGVSTGFPADSKASLYSYDEPGGGWVPFPSTSNTETFDIGKGYSIYLLQTGTQTTVKVKGAIHQGDFTFPLSPNASGAVDNGWNLIGNPYACPILWGGVGWSTPVDVNNTVYIRDNAYAGGSRFLVWNGSTGDAEFAGAIAQGQSMWVRTTGPSPVLTVTESAKLSNGNTTLWRKQTDETPSNKLIIELTKDNLVDRAYLNFNTLATDKFDSKLDGVKRLNDYFNISSRSSDSVSLAINNIADTSCVKTVELAVQTKTPGNYSLHFSGNILDKSMREIMLIDRFASSRTVLKPSGTYNFNVTADKKSSDANRFQLSFNTSSKPQIAVKGNTLTSSYETGNQWYYNGEKIEQATASTYEITKPGNYQVRVADGVCGISSDNITMMVTGLEKTPAESVKVYPNPAKNMFHIQGPSQGEGVLFSIVTVYGTTIQRGMLSANDFESGKDITISENIPSGIYFIRLQSEHLNYTTKLSIE